MIIRDASSTTNPWHAIARGAYARAVEDARESIDGSCGTPIPIAHAQLVPGLSNDETTRTCEVCFPNARDWTP